MTRIYKPTTPQLGIASLMKRYDKRQSKQNQTEKAESPHAERRRGRQDSSARSEQRVERRRQRLVQSYEIAMNTIEELAMPQAIYAASSEDGVEQLRTWLPYQAASAYIGLCTLGEKLDSHMRGLTESDLAGAAILNEVALAWIVAITQEMRQEVHQEVRPINCKVGAAYRPGLGRWPLQVQTIVFQEIPTNEIGVSLTESLLMLPSFSTSLVIPILPTE